MKLLGSPLGTMEDTKRRKILALAAPSNIENILKKKESIQNHIFDIYFCAPVKFAQ